MTKGEQWAEQVRAAYDLNEAQDVLVGVIGDIMDTLAGPLDVVERRQQQLALMRGLAQIGLPDSDDEVTRARQSATSRKASRAARARWAREAIN